MARRTLVLDQPVEAVETTKKKSRKGLFIGVAVLALVPIVGSTYAASIAVNSGSAIEFGQGQNAVTACDTDITITPTSTFTANGSSAGTFSLNTVALGGVDTTACNGKTFKLIARDSSGAALTDGTIIFKLDSTITGTNAGISTTTAISGASGVVSSPGTSGIVTLDPTGTISSSSLGRFTIESS